MSRCSAVASRWGGSSTTPIRSPSIAPCERATPRRRPSPSPAQLRRGADPRPRDPVWLSTGRESQAAAAPEHTAPAARAYRRGRRQGGGGGGGAGAARSAQLEQLDLEQQ